MMLLLVGTLAFLSVALVAVVAAQGSSRFWSYR